MWWWNPTSSDFGADSALAPTSPSLSIKLCTWLKASFGISTGPSACRGSHQHCVLRLWLKHGLTKALYVIWVSHMSTITDLGSRSFLLFNFVLFFKGTTFPHGDPIFHQAVVKVFPWNAKDGSYIIGMVKAGALAENGWQHGLDRRNEFSLRWFET